VQLRARVFIFAILFLFLNCPAMSYAQRPGNSNAFYQQLRALVPGGGVVAVNNLELKRDAATFTFRSGSIAFYGEVNGKVTGAVFKGEGHIHLVPPTAEERHNLAITNHNEEFEDDFDQVVMRFTDATSAELHKAGAVQGTADHGFAEAAQQLHNFQRNKLLYNFDLRLLADVLSPAQGGYFMAAIHGKKYHNLFFTVDPHGAPEVEPEEVALMAWNDWGPAYLAAFRLKSIAAPGAAVANSQNDAYRIENEDLDVTIEKNGFLTGLATVHIVALQDGLSVAPLTLYSTLRVSKVETDKGDPLDFVQEKKEEDSDFGVVLAKPLNKGETASVRIAYGGKDVVQNEGGANYYPIARQSWYPNASSGLGNYATYHMLFHVAKGLQLIATGTKVSDTTDGRITTTEWKTDVPLAVIGFNLGKFTMKEATFKIPPADSLTIDAYANTETPDSLAQASEAMSATPNGRDGMRSLEGSATGKINTASMLPAQLSQGQVAAQIYNNFFGPVPFTKIALTQQFACNYGQSWPMLVYLPICGFLDTTQQNAFGLDPANMYWKTVTAHEVAHQWWGQTVGFKSYRDQWMSEGFAQESASIFLLATRPKPDDFLQFWKQQRKLITEKNSMGFRPIDVGPVTMGFRLSTEKTGWGVYQNLVYPKGGYILHMIRMMMWTQKEGDTRFIATMHDFVSTYRLKAATTEDFKAIVEKHMSPGMDLEGNQKMDWFFREYVYGTDLPSYHFESQATQNGDATTLHYKLTQSGVSAEFRNTVPLYLELTDGKILRLGAVRITGASTVDQTVQLPKLPAPVKRAAINYYYDLLCTDN